MIEVNSIYRAGSHFVSYGFFPFKQFYQFLCFRDSSFSVYRTTRVPNIENGTAQSHFFGYDRGSVTNYFLL